MLFYTFRSDAERRNHNGSAFIEIQFCKLPERTAIRKIVSADRIKHWQDDSLYIADENTFCREYSCIFSCGIYNNLQCGKVDIYGINYFTPALAEMIIQRLDRDKPADYEILMKWLVKSRTYNGFYVLGL